MSEIVQLKGNLKLGPDVGSAVEYGTAISEFSLKRKRTEIKVPATLATGFESVAAGALSESLGIGFHSSTAAASVWAELYDAIDTDTAQLYFEGTQNPGVVSADNPKWSGTIVILSLDTGGPVNKLREQKQTFPLSEKATKVIAP